MQTMATVKEMIRMLNAKNEFKTEEDDNLIKCAECKKKFVDVESKQNKINMAIFQMLENIEEKINALSINMTEKGQKMNDLKMEIMHEVKNIKTEVNNETENIKTEAEKNQTEMKNRLNNQRIQMNSIKKKGEMNDKALSTLFVQVHNLRAETKEDLKDMRVIQEMKLRECNRTVSKTSEAMSTQFHSLLEKNIEKEVTSKAKKHREEKYQLSKKTEKNIFQLENSIVVLKPQVLSSGMNNTILPIKESGCPLSVRWTISGLQEMMEQRESFRVQSEEFQFPGFPFAARAQMRWNDDGDAHFSLLFADEDFESVNDLPSRLFFMLENQRMRFGKGRSGLMGYVKGTAFNYFLTRHRNLIDKSCFTDPSFNLNDAVVVGIFVEPDTMNEETRYNDDFYFEMNEKEELDWAQNNPNVTNKRGRYRK